VFVVASTSPDWLTKKVRLPEWPQAREGTWTT
jgi:hypothetical protein